MPSRLDVSWERRAGCGKPEFFIKKKPLFEVHLETGMLYNTDGGTPMVPIGMLLVTSCSGRDRPLHAAQPGLLLNAALI